MNTAIVHDWLTSSIGGSENVLQKINILFPSPVYTLLYDKKKLQKTWLQNAALQGTFFQNFPFKEKYFRLLLPLFPRAIERLNLKKFDLILSSSHCIAKSIQKNENQLHICYCHTPARYAWDLMDSYLKETRLPHFLLKKLLINFQKWDLETSKRVDYFIANSHFVKARIETFYQMPAEVIYPPVDTKFFQPRKDKEDFFITASRLVKNKKIELIVEAFKSLPNHKLLVVGDGPKKKELESKASQNIIFTGSIPKEELRNLYQRAKAFIFAGIEDFGIAPVEALACGTPVIALSKGGLLETVDSTCGLFFNEQTPESILSAVKRFEKMKFSSSSCRKKSESFSEERFNRQYQSFVIDKYSLFQSKRTSESNRTCRGLRN